MQLLNNGISMEELWPLIREVTESGGEFRLYPRGTSMRSLLREGKDSVALVRPGNLCRGDICLYRRRDGAFILHRLVKWKDGQPVFCGDNQTALEYGVPESAVIAVVAAVYRGEKRREIGSFPDRFYRATHLPAPCRFIRFLPRRGKSALKKIFKK